MVGDSQLAGAYAAVSLGVLEIAQMIQFMIRDEIASQEREPKAENQVLELLGGSL